MRKIEGIRSALSQSRIQPVFSPAPPTTLRTVWYTEIQLRKNMPIQPGDPDAAILSTPLPFLNTPTLRLSRVLYPLFGSTHYQNAGINSRGLGVEA